MNPLLQIALPRLLRGLRTGPNQNARRRRPSLGRRRRHTRITRSKHEQCAAVCHRVSIAYAEMQPQAAGARGWQSLSVLARLGAQDWSPGLEPYR